MGFVTTSTATGRGTLSLGGLQQPNEVGWSVLTPATEARLIGAAGTRRVFQQGSWGIGGTPGAGPLAGIFVVSWWTFIDIETFDFTRPVPYFGGADTMFWDIEPGGVMYFEVDWP
jgi:hypothetical protein